MRKDHRQETFVCGLQVTGDAKALDLFRDLCANHMRAQQLAGFSIEIVFTKPSVSPLASALPLL